jgi:hypothetical protein
LFDSEYLVAVYGSSAFVTRKVVRVDQQPTADKSVFGSVLAYLLGEQGGKALIELPGEPVVGTLRSWVPTEDLAHA